MVTIITLQSPVAISKNHLPEYYIYVDESNNGNKEYKVFDSLTKTISMCVKNTIVSIDEFLRTNFVDCTPDKGWNINKVSV